MLIMLEKKAKLKTCDIWGNMASVAGKVMINEIEHSSMFIGMFSTGLAFNKGVLNEKIYNNLF